jgi:drug/metabolite transporter (DMT)-like permease
MEQARRLSPISGAVMLVLATALWGSNVVVTKVILPGIPPGAINFARFAIAGVVLLPFIRFDRRMWRDALGLAVLLLAGYGSQTVALRYTTANRAAFITAMNVIFVPILAAFFGHRVRVIVWAAAITALIGCGLLCGEGGGPNIGDLWSLGTAITWASYIFRFESVSAKYPPLQLAVAQFVPMTVMSGIWTVAANEHVTDFHWLGLIYLGVGATATTMILQAAGQRVVPAPQTAVIFCMEPVFAAICSFIFLGERLAIRGYLGAGLILLAAIASQLPAMIGTPQERAAVELHLP